MDKLNKFEEVVNYVVYKCREENFPISDALVAYITRLMYDESVNLSRK